MTHDQFQELLKKYRQGTCLPDEQKVVDDWYAAIESEQNLLLTSEQETELKNRYWRNVNEHIQSKKLRARRHILLSWPSVAVAASLVFAIGAFFYLQPRETTKPIVSISPKEIKSSKKVIHNKGVEPTHVALADGTQIVLRPGSKISFLEAFDKPKREIFLEGEAFFEVAHDVNRPFFVYTNEVTTKVLGTSFTIRALPKDKNITVAVKTGKVSVYTHQDVSKERSKPSETILTPNQQIVYNREENKVSRMLVSVPEIIKPKEEVRRMRFEEASVIEIFTALEEIYGVDIVFDEKLLAACTLTTSISDGTIYNRLDIICKAIGATYTVEETQIVVSGLGCN
jgi:transmembrane sensor